MRHFLHGIALFAAIAVAAPVRAQAPTTSPPPPAEAPAAPAQPPAAQSQPPAGTAATSAASERPRRVTHRRHVRRYVRRYYYPRYYYPGYYYWPRYHQWNDIVADQLNAQQLWYGYPGYPPAYGYYRGY